MHLSNESVCRTKSKLFRRPITSRPKGRKERVGPRLGWYENNKLFFHGRKPPLTLSFLRKDWARCKLPLCERERVRAIQFEFHFGMRLMESRYLVVKLQTLFQTLFLGRKLYYLGRNFQRELPGHLSIYADLV